MEESRAFLSLIEARLSNSSDLMAQTEGVFESMDTSFASHFDALKLSLAAHREQLKDAAKGHRSSQLKDIALDEASFKATLNTLLRMEKELLHETFKQKSPNTIASIAREHMSVACPSLNKEPFPGTIHIPNPFCISATSKLSEELKKPAFFVGFRPIYRDVSTIGSNVLTVGKSGSDGPLLFNAPDGVAVHPMTDRIYIVDQKNSRIQVLNSDLSFYEIYESKTTPHGKFSEPRGINVNIFGTIGVVDCSKSRVLLFSSEWVLMKEINCKSSQSNEFREPRHITSDQQGYFYVSDRDNNRVKKFSPTGEFVLEFQLGDVDPTATTNIRPYGITVNDANEVVIVPMSGSNMYFHQTSGVFIRSVTIKELSGNANFMSRGPGGGVLLTDFGAGSFSIFFERRKFS